MRIAVFGAAGRMGKLVRAEAKRRGVPVVPLNAHPDVIVDFSSPQGTSEACDLALQYKCALLTGTTGLRAAEFKKINKTAKEVPVLHSANFSAGLHGMIAAMKSIPIQPDRIQIQEIHHIHKKDKPSGTSLLIKKELESAGLKVSRIKSVRKGEIFGIHAVTFKAGDELVTFTHEAKSRRIFARGALEVASWLFKKKPGLYRMQDYMTGEKNGKR